ncbi:MAG: CBS domain-containing protein [Deltaproteobacteria bacterium]|nr:CBS domain-containing protein [Deltaproteobacteria bacterium]
MIAQSVMDTRFHSLLPEQTIVEAIRLFEKAGKKKKKKIFGMMVIDADDRLVGMLSMYDILLFIQPKHMRILGEMEDLSYEPIFQGLVNRVKKIRVEDIMSTDLVTIKPDTHLMVVVDMMTKKRIRRLPVVQEDRVVGIVYRSSVFDHLMKMLID